jgi:thymidylate synthase (FAD)
MAEVGMNVKLIAHTQIAYDFLADIQGSLGTKFEKYIEDILSGKPIALTAIRTCYSPNKPSEIVALEGEKYFGQQATDGEEGTEADRLLRMIFNSKHTSTLEHLNYTFAIEGISRASLAQLTRHRHFSYSVQSQRYVKFGTDDKSGGFDYITPDSITKKSNNPEGSQLVFDTFMQHVQDTYDLLRDYGIPAEDVRAILPNAAATNLVLTGNLRSLLDFYSKRKPGRGAQSEIAELAERIKDEVVKVDAWTAPFFDKV